MLNTCLTQPPHDIETDAPLAAPLRRRLLGAALLAGGNLSIPLTALAASVGRAAGLLNNFAPLPTSTADIVQLSPGLQAELLFAWGDPISDGPWAQADASDSPADQMRQAGMHHDGMHFFPFTENGLPSSSRGLLCINHEYTDEGLLHPDGTANWSAEKVAKSKAAHGVSIIEVRRTGNQWQVVRPSSWARRITADTPCQISGPARAHPAMLTRLDRRGVEVQGTLNNCAMGVTPWGTYLTCEENFNAYFKGQQTPSPDQERYGIRAQGAGRWHEFDERFDTTQHPNEPNRFGWVVEIDPWNPAKPPVKRTALGRFKHEGATVTQTPDGHIVVYMGDDERFEYLYKFVSRDHFQIGSANNANLLDHGILYVARFDEGGSGQWLPLRHGEKYASGSLTAEHGFANQGDVVIRCRQAADIAGATRMDRPEWIAVNPQNSEVYVTLTNNTQRGLNHAPDAANPRARNLFGHILRWRENDGNASANRFTWDIFALAGASTDSESYANPDGLWFDPSGRLWIQTDISSSALQQGEHTRFGNNQMLVADVGTGHTQRVLTGPNGCEVTGISITPDARSLFVNIQHPGESANEYSDPSQPTSRSSWPANQFSHATGGRPRSGTIVITRQDGKPITA